MPAVAVLLLLLLELYRADGSGHAMMMRTKNVLSKALRDAYRKDLIAANPMDKATLPRPPQELRGAMGDGPDSVLDDEEVPFKVWDREQIAAFLAGVADEYDLGLWTVVCRTGLRRGEALGLKWGDIKLDWRDPKAAGGRLYVRRQLNADKKLTPPKTASSKRDFSLDAGTVAALRRHRRAQQAWRLRLGLGPIADDQPVFPSVRRGGGWRRPRAVTERWRTLIRRVNTKREADGLPPLPVIRLHDARHSFATNALDAGVDVRAVSTRIGHANPSLTYRVYAKWLRNPDEAAAAAIGAFLDGTKAAASSDG